MKRNSIISIVCGLLIILWTYAALSKLVEFERFTAQLELQPLPSWSIPILRWVLPIGELLIAILLSGIHKRYLGLIASTVLMALFSVYVLLALTGSFGDIPCSCAGIISKLHWKGHMVFNLFFLAISVLGTYLKKQDSSPKNPNKQTVVV